MSSSPGLTRAARWAAPLIWMLLIFLFSHQPSLPSAPAAWLDLLVKKSLHALAYAILGLLWLRALRETALRHPAAWAFAIGVAYALSDEWHQRFVPGRSGRLLDVAIDVLGLALGLLWAVWRDGRRHRGRG